MADADWLTVCDKCLHPTDGSVLCPECKESVRLMPSLLLQSLRILRAKGWVVLDWCRNSGNTVGFKLEFFMFAPTSVMASSSSSTLDYKGIFIDLMNLKPSILSMAGSSDEAAKNLYAWAVMVPSFALPFGQDLCDECRQQGGDWYFSRCRCPSSEGWVNFSDGIPAKCIYADAQVVTKEVRLGQLGEFFQKNPIARRKVRREFATA